ncbi:DUF4214 domain-containing protein [Subtercola sp. YIM 133946]|uniref:DUF4214 domain-containing protein n=1 Tax=Subtercola sp. YIM 133946 TaxID=3118909 RepID=UPI002F957F61
MLQRSIALFAAIVVAVSMLGAFGAADTASAALPTANSAASVGAGASPAGSAAATANTANSAVMTSISPVTSDPQQLAKVIVAAQNAGNFATDPTSIYTREIAPVASGTALNGCGVDVRILQVIVLTLNRFGSARVSDIERPCIGSNLNCGAPTYSVHCLDPGEAIDFARVGGVTLDGSNTRTRDFLTYLDFFLPRGTNAGQEECRSSSPLQLANINQFDDSCNHQHLDFRNTNQPLSASALATVLPTVAQASLYVKMLYGDYLDRPASTDEYTGWATQLANGAARSAVSASFVNSDEYRLIRIDAAYKKVLGRSADAGGRQNWLNAMRAGLITTDDIETSFYASQEYYLRHGNTDLGFVSSLYTTLLARKGSTSDYTFWAGLVAQYGRQWVVTQFWSSQETISQRISLMYRSYLGRMPDAGGLAGWVAVALQIGDSGLRSALTSSDEYWNLAQSGTRGSTVQQVQSVPPEAAPTPAPTATPTPAPTATPTPAAPTPSSTAAPTPAGTPAPTESASTPAPKPTPLPTATPTPTPAPTPTPSATLAPTAPRGSSPTPVP